LNAESPSLRAKIERLTEGDTGSGGHNDAKAELERRLHMLVQRGLDVPPVAPSKRRGSVKISSQGDALANPPEPAWEQESWELWTQGDLVDDSQPVEVLGDMEADNRDLSQQDGPEWLDLSQASFILDENGQRISFEDVDHEEYSYQLVPLTDD
jgi:hypothetical protein